MPEPDSAAHPTSKNVALGVLAVVIPFAAVGVKRGFFTTHFWLCFLLTCFGYFPGVIHASYIIWSPTPKQQQQQQPNIVVVHHQHLPSAEPHPPAYLQHQHDLEAAHGHQALSKLQRPTPNPFTEAEIHGDEVKVVEKGERFGGSGRRQHAQM